MKSFASWQARMLRKNADRWEKWPVQMSLFTVGLSLVNVLVLRWGRANAEAELARRIRVLEEIERAR